jgi:CHASE1-domain containing sensor protein
MKDDQWHLSKSVPITFLLAILLQTISLVWFVAELDSNIQANRRDVDQHRVRLETIESNVQGQAVSLARIDENIRHIRTTVDRVLRENNE